MLVETSTVTVEQPVGPSIRTWSQNVPKRDVHHSANLLLCVVFRGPTHHTHDDIQLRALWGKQFTMGLRIDFDGVSDLEAKRRIEDRIRECIGEPPTNEDWRVSVGMSFGYTAVAVITPRQRRNKLFFFSDVRELIDAIPEWLQQYPVR